MIQRSRELQSSSLECLGLTEALKSHLKCWMMKHCFAAKGRKTICIYVWCVLLGKLLSVPISWLKRWADAELWWRTWFCGLYYKLHPPTLKRVGDCLDLLQNAIPHLFLPTLFHWWFTSSIRGCWMLQKCAKTVLFCELSSLSGPWSEGQADCSELCSVFCRYFSLGC